MPKYPLKIQPDFTTQWIIRDKFLREWDRKQKCWTFPGKGTVFNSNTKSWYTLPPGESVSWVLIAGDESELETEPNA